MVIIPSDPSEVVDDDFDDDLLFKMSTSMSLPSTWSEDKYVGTSDG